jgi:SAM-dependent methyltransferase
VFDAVVSGLALNFVPRPEAAVAEFARVAAPGAVVAAYVWDYADGMQMIRHFWDVAMQVDPAAEALDEGRRFPICHAPALAETWMAAGLRRVTTTKIEIPTVFRSFDDFWRPFLGGQGPAPAYLAAQPAERREAIRQALSARLGPDIIAMSAAAWAVRGYKQV